MITERDRKFIDTQKSNQAHSGDTKKESPKEVQIFGQEQKGKYQKTETEALAEENQRRN
jgi:hypothetical protein